MKILFKFPSRSRPEKFFKVLDQYYDYIQDKENFMFLISLDSDDPNLQEYLPKLMEGRYKNLIFNIGLSQTKIEAINRDVELCQDWDIIVAIADDMIPQIQGFDNIIRSWMKKAYPDLDGVLFFNDGVSQLNTLPICGKKYYDRFGWIYYPGYISVFADNDFMERAKVLNKQTYIDMVIIRHDHPLWTGEPMDAQYQKNEDQNLYMRDNSTYQTRLLNNFDIDLNSLKEEGPTISICMMVKNEEKNLLRLLPNITRFADEIVIVDTGSMDKTKDIIKNYGIKLIEEPWIDGKINFSKARNTSIDHATMSYVWWIDADDDLPFMSYIQAKRFLKDHPDTALMVTLISIQPEGQVVSGQLRIFPRLDTVRSSGRVHEQIIGTLQKNGIKVTHLDVPMYHLGYNSDIEIKNKLLRNISILQEQDEDGELDFYNALAYSRSLSAVGRFREGLEKIDLALSLWQEEPTETSKDMLIMAFLTKSSILDVLGFTKEAILTLESCDRIFPNNKMVHMALGEYYTKLKQYKDAYRVLKATQDAKFKIGIFPMNVAQMDAAERKIALIAALHVGDFSFAESIVRLLFKDPNYSIARTAIN